MASEGKEIRGFQDLVVWRRAMDLVVEAYSVTNHLSVATDSLMELETQLLIAARLGYLKPEQARTLLDTLGEVRRLLAAMVRALRKERRPDSR
jgi:hypothetical protein